MVAVVGTDASLGMGISSSSSLELLELSSSELVSSSDEEPLLGERQREGEREEGGRGGGRKDRGRKGERQREGEREMCVSECNVQNPIILGFSITLHKPL